MSAVNKKDLSERDICTKFTVADDPGELLAKLDEAEKQAAALRDQSKAVPAEALLR